MIYLVKQIKKMVVIQIKKKREKKENERKREKKRLAVLHPHTYTPKGFGITARAAESDPIHITLRLNLIGHSVVDNERKVAFQSFLWPPQFSKNV